MIAGFLDKMVFKRNGQVGALYGVELIAVKFDRRAVLAHISVKLFSLGVGYQIRRRLRAAYRSDIRGNKIKLLLSLNKEEFALALHTVLSRDRKCRIGREQRLCVGEHKLFAVVRILDSDA